MGELGFITETMMKTALAQPARAVKPAVAGSVNYVADWIMDVLDDLVGRIEQDLVVETSIDPALQTAAEKSLVDELALRGQKFDVAQGAIVAMSPDGAVRALVGGRLTPRVNTIAPSSPSASRAQRSSRSSILPRWNGGSRPRPSARTSRLRSRAGSRRTTAVSITAR